METCKEGDEYSAPSILLIDLLYLYKSLEITGRAHEIETTETASARG